MIYYLSRHLYFSKRETVPIEFAWGSLKLTPEQWRRLEAIAAELQSVAPTGQHAKRPSWRTLIKDIANGAIICARKEGTE